MILTLNLDQSLRSSVQGLSINSATLSLPYLQAWESQDSLTERREDLFGESYGSAGLPPDLSQVCVCAEQRYPSEDSGELTLELPLVSPNSAGRALKHKID